VEVDIVFFFFFPPLPYVGDLPLEKVSIASSKLTNSSPFSGLLPHPFLDLKDRNFLPSRPIFYSRSAHGLDFEPR